MNVQQEKYIKQQQQQQTAFYQRSSSAFSLEFLYFFLFLSICAQASRFK